MHRVQGGAAAETRPCESYKVRVRPEAPRRCLCCEREGPAERLGAPRPAFHFQQCATRPAALSTWAERPALARRARPFGARPLWHGHGRRRAAGSGGRRPPARRKEGPGSSSQGADSEGLGALTRRARADCALLESLAAARDAAIDPEWRPARRGGPTRRLPAQWRDGRHAGEGVPTAWRWRRPVFCPGAVTGPGRASGAQAPALYRISTVLPRRRGRSASRSLGRAGSPPPSPCTCARGTPQYVQHRPHGRARNGGPPPPSPSPPSPAAAAGPPDPTSAHEGRSAALRQRRRRRARGAARRRRWLQAPFRFRRAGPDSDLPSASRPSRKGGYGARTAHAPGRSPAPAPRWGGKEGGTGGGDDEHPVGVGRRSLLLIIYSCCRSCRNAYKLQEEKGLFC